MKVHMTFTLDERDRRGIALEHGCRKPAKRTQVVQSIAAAWQDCLNAARGKLRQRELNPDPNQQKLPFETTGETSKRRNV